MRKVKLRMKEENKYKIIKELVDHNGNKNRAAISLGLSKRQINRLINIYMEKGKSGFVHGNRLRKPVNTLDKLFSEDIVLLYKNKYYDFNFSHFRDYIEKYENINVSYKFVYTILTKANFISPMARRKTKIKYKRKQLIDEKKVVNKTDEEIDCIVNHEIKLEDSHPRQEKPKNFGEVIEMDGSIHKWFGGFKTCLHLAVDKASNRMLGGHFDYQETLNGYYHILYQILTIYGIPYMFRTDNRTVFNFMYLNPEKRTPEKDVLTQFGYACKQLGIELETTSVSQAKGLIERDNGTFQGRLVSELRLNNIATIEEANKYLNEVFIPEFNNRFALDYKKFPSVFETSPSLEKINYTLAVLSPRIIDNGNSIKYKNKYYQPYADNSIKCFSPKTKCLVINAFNGELLVAIDEKVFEMKELSRNERFSKNFEEVPENKERKKYIPPMTHPWRLQSFKEQLYKSHQKHEYA